MMTSHDLQRDESSVTSHSKDWDESSVTSHSRDWSTTASHDRDWDELSQTSQDREKKSVTFPDEKTEGSEADFIIDQQVTRSGWAKCGPRAKFCPLRPFVRPAEKFFKLS